MVYVRLRATNQQPFSMIVFGHNNFKIKSFSPRELGIPENPGDQKITLEVRQRYFHLFWIPFFPIGKAYVVRKEGDSNMYEMPLELQHVLSQRDDIKTPWYSFALIFLALFIGVSFFGNEKMKDIKWENRFYVEQANQKMRVKYPTTGDYYKFKAFECSDTNSRPAEIIVKVIAYDEDSIEFSSAYMNILDSNQYSYSIQSEINKNLDYRYNSFELKKEDIMNSFHKEYRDYGDDVVLKDMNWCYVFKGMDREKLDVAQN